MRLNDDVRGDGPVPAALPVERLPVAPPAARRAPAPSEGRSALLDALPASEAALLRGHLTPAAFPAGASVQEPGKPVESCHFVEEGLVAILALTGDGKPVQVGMVGRDGMVGASVALGAALAQSRAVAQTACAVQSLPAARLREVLPDAPVLRGLLLAHVRARLAQSMRFAACSARHGLEQRVARWILDASGRLEDPAIGLTHDFLASLLGVRRASVTCALHVLEGDRAIFARRGQILIRDRDRLRSLACSCPDL
ncbi:Crp/Fnr family transcriptional regulator [Faunimonas sp. B44]|uniref:Crp/Fnr family transcriptional regulator n=1 Tax=Faunimonas sp. B44 TaxID=3461493 RepID=UPI004045075D